MQAVALYTAAGYAVLTCLLWLFGCGYILRQLFAAPKISEVDAPEPARYPSISVLVPACNEQASIEPALRSLLEQEYPELEVVAIDDRSTDQTGVILDGLDEEYDHLKVLHIEQLPEGWMGKTHALQRGYEVCGGDWVLMTDADIHYEPGALREIMAVGLDASLDQISCFPMVQNSGFFHEIAFDAWFTASVGFQNLAGVQDVDCDDYFALGAFNMVRRETFEETEGFEWLRMEIADDMGTARMMRDQGAKQGFYYAFDQLKLNWYDSLGDMIDGLEKNSVGVVAHYDYLKGYAIPAVWALVFFGPLVGFALPWMWTTVLSAAVVATAVPCTALAARRLERAVLPYLFFPIGMWAVMYALVQSTYACAKRGGIDWRGTHYPIEQLRAHQRVKF